jgi:hypothetical protein
VGEHARTQSLCQAERLTQLKVTLDEAHGLAPGTGLLLTGLVFRLTFWLVSVGQRQLITGRDSQAPATADFGVDHPGPEKSHFR